MLAAESPTTTRIRLPKPGIRIPLKPKNTLLSNHLQQQQQQQQQPKSTKNKPNSEKPQNVPISIPVEFDHSNKENNNNPIFANPIESMDASLAEELSAVRKKLERLRLDKEKTEKVLEERERVLDLRMVELVERGELQKELEIEVDRLYRLKQLKLACMKMSPIRWLREKAMEKKNVEAQFESPKEEQVKDELVGESSTTESSTLSSEKTLKSTSSTSTSTSTTSTSTSNSTSMLKKMPIPMRLSLESEFDK